MQRMRRGDQAGRRGHVHAVHRHTKEQEEVKDSMTQIGFLLLCGGKSRRMGMAKALMEIEGERLLDRVARAGEGFAQRILSVNDDQVPTPEGFLRCADVYPGCGPMAGIHAAFARSSCDALVVAPCDAPHYSARLAQHLADQYDPALDAVILMNQSGEIQPLCGLYTRGCVPVLERHLQQDKLRMKPMLDLMATRYISLPPELQDRVFINLNTPQDFADFKRREKGSAQEAP